MLASLLASLPILLILLLMTVFHFGAVKASLIGYGFCLLVAVLFYGANQTVLYYSHIKGLWYAIDVLLIIWSAFLLYLIVEKAGMIQLMSELLPILAPSKELQAILIGWIFASFLQGVGGFGVPVAVIAPILVGLDFSPLQAVLIPSVGHAWAVTFGSLGSSFRAILAITGQPIQPLGIASGALLGIASLGCGFYILYLVGKWQAIRRSGWITIFVGAVMGSILVFNIWKGLWNLASFLAATAGLLGFLLVMRIVNANKPVDRKTYGKLLFSFSGYLILVVTIFMIQFIPFIHAFLQQATFSASLPAFQTSPSVLNIPVQRITAEKVGNLSLFIHPGVVLLYGNLLIYIFFRLMKKIPPGSLTGILKDLTKRLLPTTLVVLAMANTAVVMENCGMTTNIAGTISNIFARNYLWLSPWIGGLGAFITGSNTNSNLLFGLLQENIAVILDIPVFLVLAGQTAGASVTSILAPAKIIVGTSTSGLLGKEGWVLRSLIPFVILEVSLISIILFIMSLFW